MIDVMSRSLSLATYQSIIKELHKTYNIVYMGENKEVDDSFRKVKCLEMSSSRSSHGE